MFVRVVFTARRGGFVPYETIAMFRQRLRRRVPNEVTVTSSAVDVVATASPADDEAQRRVRLLLSVDDSDIDSVVAAAEACSVQSLHDVEDVDIDTEWTHPVDGFEERY